MRFCEPSLNFWIRRGVISVGASPAHPTGSLRTVAAWFAPYRDSVILMFGAMGIEMLFYATIPMSFKLMIDRALLGDEPNILFGILLGLGVGVVLVCAAGVGRDYLHA